MKICYYDTKMEKSEKSIFLAGPTVREYQKETWKGGFWRDDALKILEELGFDGVVYVPEQKIRFENIQPNDLYFEWEWEALHSSSVVLFWVPRKFPELPAMSTNIEFGFYNGIGKTVVYGRPDDADKVDYLDRLYYKLYKKKAQNSLENTVKSAVLLLK